MATSYTTLKLTDNEIRALCKWVRIGQEEEGQLDSETAAKRLKALENIDRKIEKEGWE